MEPPNLNFIKDSIERMNKFHQVEVLRILREGPTVTLNENKNGVFVNLTELSVGKVRELEEYVQYVAVQEDQLSELEDKKEQFMSAFYGLVPDAVGTRKQITLTGVGEAGENHNENKDKDNKARNIKVIDGPRESL